MAFSLSKVFKDDESGAESFGRTAAGFCFVASICCYSGGLLLPALGSYCITYGQMFLETGAWLYVASKGKQALTSVFNWAKSKNETTNTEATAKEAQ